MYINIYPIFAIVSEPQCVWSCMRQCASQSAIVLPPLDYETLKNSAAHVQHLPIIDDVWLPSVANLNCMQCQMQQSTGFQSTNSNNMQTHDNARQSMSTKGNGWTGKQRDTTNVNPQHQGCTSRESPAQDSPTRAPANPRRAGGGNGNGRPHATKHPLPIRAKKATQTRPQPPGGQQYPQVPLRP